MPTPPIPRPVIASLWPREDHQRARLLVSEDESLPIQPNLARLSRGTEDEWSRSLRNVLETWQARAEDGVPAECLPGDPLVWASLDAHRARQRRLADPMAALPICHPSA
jgi:hypothetical protein